MSIAEKLTTIAENEQKVYSKGKADGKSAEWSAFWDAYQENGNRTNYETAFRNWADECYNPKYPIVTSSGSARANSMLNQSTVTDTRVDITINAIGTTHVFYTAQSLKTIRKLIVNKNVTFTQWFTNAIALENITFEGEIGQNISFSGCNKLTRASLINIIEHLYDYSADSNTYKLTLGTTNLDKLTDSEKAIATQKGWTIA
jgi:hypothetical protein